MLSRQASGEPVSVLYFHDLRVLFRGDVVDFLDKLIGFKLSDIFYAIFHQYYKNNGDARALKLANYIKYGTDSDKEIWMLRYGLSFEDIEWAAPCIESINEEEIVFNGEVEKLDEGQRAIIEPYLYT